MTSNQHSLDQSSTSGETVFFRRRAIGILLAPILLVAVLLMYGTGHALASNGTFQQYTYNGSAGSRPYFVYTPANYQVGTSVPLIVMLHGCTQTPSDFAAGTQMNTLADQDQFIVVYPQQTSTYNSLECWNWFQSADQSRGSGEPAIIAGIVQTIEQSTSQWTIDTHRIYVAGMSAGAAMAVIMGATYPDIFAAIGVHSGLEYQAATTQTAATTAQSQGGPNPTQQGQAAYNAMGSAARIVPTIDFQGQSDYTVYPVNGDQVIEQWMETDHLASNGTYSANFNAPSTTTNGQVSGSGGHSYTTQTWNDTAGNEIEEYWKINSMGHAWSGGSSNGSYTDPNGPSATNAMYAFFMNHPFAIGNQTPVPTNTPAPGPTSTPAPVPTNTPVPPTSTSTPSSVDNGVTATGLVALGASGYFTEEDVNLANTSPITALTVTITINKTPGVAYSAMYSTATVPVMLTHTDNGSTLVFVYTLDTGQTLPTGTYWTFAAQITGTGTLHPTSNDTYSVTSTSGGVQSILNGHF